jgi:hypothetical protein
MAAQSLASQGPSLIEAAHAGDLQRVKDILAASDEHLLLWSDDEGVTPLMTVREDEAAERMQPPDHRRRRRRLRSPIRSLPPPRCLPQTPQAAEEGHAEVVEELLQAGCPWNQVGRAAHWRPPQPPRSPAHRQQPRAIRSRSPPAGPPPLAARTPVLHANCCRSALLPAGGTRHP